MKCQPKEADYDRNDDPRRVKFDSLEDNQAEQDSEDQIDIERLEEIFEDTHTIFLEDVEGREDVPEGIHEPKNENVPDVKIQD
jgi:hypothetical protein